MNREKESQLPLMQVNFIDTICLPVYEVRVCSEFKEYRKILGNSAKFDKLN